MSKTKEKLIQSIEELVAEGFDIFYIDAIKNKQLSEDQTEQLMSREAFKERFHQFFTINMEYQKWYSVASSLVSQILPDRYPEFKSLYKIDNRKSDNIDSVTYTISDYLVGLRITRGAFSEVVVNAFNAYSSKFQTQINILSSALNRLNSSLSDIEGILQHELFENEIEASKELLKKSIKGHQECS